MLPALLIGLTFLPTTKPSLSNVPMSIVPIPASEKCRRMRRCDRCTYIRLLAKKRDLSGLLDVCDSNVESTSAAASYAVRLMNSSDAVKFCKKLKVGSPKWGNAFWALACHDQEVVSEYVVSLMEDPATKNHAIELCYKLCTETGWDVLEVHAIDDQYSTSRFVCVNQAPDELTIGDLARKYLKKLGAGRQVKR